MKKTFTILSCVLTLFSVPLFAATPSAAVAGSEAINDQKQRDGAINGRVVDNSGMILPGATIWLNELNMGAIADANGFFYIPGIPAGRQEITVSFIGYQPYVTNIDIQPGVNLDVNFNIEEGLEVEELVVYGIVKGQQKALSQQQSAVGVSNVISADQMGRFPDANIGDAMKRVPGINVQYDQGEARFGQVRGTAPDLTSVTLNGNRLPSAEGEARAAQLDLIPSDMIQTIEVKKVVTADMDGDAIGGSVNLITKNSPNRQTINATVGTGYNPISKKMQFNGAASWGDRFIDDKLGIMAALSYQNNPIGSDNIEAVWSQDDDGKAYVSEFENRQYYVHRERQSYSLSLDYAFNANHKIEAKGMYNRRNDWENRYRLTYKDVTPQEDGTYTAYLRRQTKGGVPGIKNARLERQQTSDISLKGTHNFGIFSAEWFGDYATASEKRPNERYIGFESDEDNPIVFNVDLSDEREPLFSPKDPSLMALNPSNFIKLDELTESFESIKEREFKAGLNLKWVLAKGDFGNELRAGYKYQNKYKHKDKIFYDVEPLNGDFNQVSMSAGNLYDATRNKFYAGDYRLGDFVSKQYLGSLNFNDPTQFSLERNYLEEVGNYSGREIINAAYLRFDQKLGNKVLLIAGLRMERTSLNYSGFTVNVDADDNINIAAVKRKTNNNNFLPSVLLKVTPVKDLVLRASFTTTIARPKFSQLVPGDVLNFSDEEFTQGNPDIQNTVSNNVDLMVEYYFPSVGLISAGIYYKQIKDFIVDAHIMDYTVNGVEWKDYYKAVNAGNARLFGFEAAFQRDLGFIAPALKNFGIYANYTYNHSKVTKLTDPIFSGRDKNEITLPGTPKNLVNASIYFENKRVTAAVSFNYAGAFLDNEAMGVSAFEDRYYDKVTYLDANVSVRATDFLTVYAEVNNLLNQPLRYYQGVKERTMQAEYYGVRSTLGIKLNF